jgi:hypothetical protein
LTSLITALNSTIVTPIAYLALMPSRLNNYWWWLNPMEGVGTVDKILSTDALLVRSMGP